MNLIPVFGARTCVRLTSACAALLAMSGAHAELAQNPRAAEDAKYQCDTSGTRDDTIARARSYAILLYDLNKLACASDLLSAATENGAPDVASQTEALKSTVDYIEQVSLERDVDPAGVQTLEWESRLAKASKKIDALGRLADARFAGDPGIATLRAKADLLLHRADEPKDWVTTAKRNMSILEKIAGDSPRALDGMPLVVLGKLYLDLPPLFGGNPVRAVELLERAGAIDGADSQRLGYLALAYAQNDRNGDAKKVLDRLLVLKATPATEQYVADATIVGVGLSARLHDPARLHRFEEKRRVLFTANPELRPHVFVAVDGHGGENPLTGERQY
jgi:hypothetical protein